MNKKLFSQSASTLSILIILLMTGCSLQQSPFARKGSMNANAVQPNSNSIDSNQFAQMIVVTVSNTFHEKITEGIPINMVGTNGPMFPPPSYLEFLNELNDQYGIKIVADWPLDSLGVRCFIFNTHDDIDRNNVIERLQLDQRIETAQPMQSFHVLGRLYNDPYLELQHNYKVQNIESSHQLATGKGINVAVIDTGVDFKHEDLKSNIHALKNFVDNDNQIFRKDIHGTAISGIIAAATNNGTGMAGIAPDAKIFPMKACWQIRRNSDAARCSTFTLAKAINFAINEGVDIINLSLAGPRDPLLERLINLAIEKNVSVVAAVPQKNNSSFPAIMPSVLAVSQSENGTSIIGKKSLHAPGKQILGTTPNNQYGFFTGSSFSTAQISGIIALIKERKPHLSNDEIYTALKNSEPLFRKAQKQNTSVNACTALAKIIGSVCR